VKQTKRFISIPAYSSIGEKKMVTSIQMHEDIIKELNALKKELNLKSYEEVIRALLRSEKRLKKSYFGTFNELDEFKRDEEEDDRLS
jgi:Ribbon-helix-helix protein, copG family